MFEDFIALDKLKSLETQFHRMRSLCTVLKNIQFKALKTNLKYFSY